MKHRSPAAPLLLPFITFGIYSIVWYVKSKVEMNTRGAGIPTAWLILVPIADIWWMWRFAAGVEGVSGMSRHGAFWLLLLLGPIGAAVVQSSINGSAAARGQKVMY
ncbi:DUF4234 domain-containing protein [Arthrobacter psychrochitiniphilus]|uniref:DUF4234 domain-containing protein n=1 Tax=Arthrobacter psychrochitiniphilus TaxID=291045 RepID=UPI003F7C040A